MQNRIRSFWTIIGETVAVLLATVLITALVTLYLSLPVFWAVAKEPMHPIATGLGLIVFGLVWLFVAVSAVDAAAYIYGFRRPWLRNGRFGFRLGAPLLQRPGTAIASVVASYFLTLYAFGGFMWQYRRGPRVLSSHR
jgi:hypothetical protein